MKSPINIMYLFLFALTILPYCNNNSDNSHSSLDASGNNAKLVMPFGGEDNKDRAKSDTLEKIRNSLKKVRNAKPEEFVASEKVGEIKLIVGMSKDDIRRELGEPRPCDVFPKMGTPCKALDDWVYHFYHLPIHSYGGGLELLLSFDSTDHCIDATWVRTK